MTIGSVDSLDDFAAKVDEEFRSHRQSNQFKNISQVIDTSSSDHPTLIVHVDGDGASSLADDVEEFLLAGDNVYTQREHHSETDVRVLATIE